MLSYLFCMYIYIYIYIQLATKRLVSADLGMVPIIRHLISQKVPVGTALYAVSQCVLDLASTLVPPTGMFNYP